MDDLISREKAIDALDKIFPADPMRNDYTQGITCGAALATEYIKQLPSAQPEKRTEERTETHACDLIDRQAVRYKLVALVNEFEEILSHIREREVNDSVCGLCEYDGAYIGQSGDWCNECPGFDRDDCFKLKEKYREEWLKIDG